MPTIVLTEGELRQGESITLSLDFSGDVISAFYTNKRFTAFAERNVQWDTFTQTYYYDVDEGVVYEALNSDDVRVSDLVAGRLFVRFIYTDLQGNNLEVTEVFQVLPARTITIPPEGIEAEVLTFKNDHFYENVVTTFNFSDDASSLSTSGHGVDKTTNIDGYYDSTIDIDWRVAEYSNGDKVVWESSPVDLLAYTDDGFFGGGMYAVPSITGSGQTVIESISGNYLIKEDLTKKVTFDLAFTRNPDNEITAPLKGFLLDNNVFEYSFEGDNRLEFIEIDFGDGEKLRTYTVNEDLTHIYKRSGSYNITYTVFTVHDLPQITYRQSIAHTFEVIIEPFFYKFFNSLFNNTIYNSKGFQDLCLAWGTQMDRLYNDTQVVMDSIDSNSIDDKFIAGFATTFGDFPEIYEKIGFKELSSTYDDDKRFDFFGSYDFFDRLKSGGLTSEEKQQFVKYIQSTKNRLSGKGTPATLEEIISFFALEATVKELWTQFENQDDDARFFLDEVFDGGETETDTGLTYKRVSMPSIDNEDNFISDRSDTSYLEINTFDNVYNTYVTDSTEIVIKDGQKYVKLNFDE